MNALLVPFQYSFFVNGMIAAILLGGLTGLVGSFVVLRKMSYIGHGLSHSIFGGAVVSYVLQFNFYIGAGLWGFFSVLFINFMSKKYKIGADAAIGVITTASFALGVALISRVRHFTQNFEAALFGNILGVTHSDVLVILGVCVASVLIIFFTYKQLLFLTFDPDVARSSGINVDLIDGLFSVVLASTVIVSLQILGVTLIAAALITPPVIARLLTDNFNKMIVWSTVIGSLCGLIGMYISFYINIASGASIVLLSALVFFIVSLTKSTRLKVLTSGAFDHTH